MSSEFDNKLEVEKWKVCWESARDLEKRRDNCHKLSANISLGTAAAYGYCFFQAKEGWTCLLLCVLFLCYCVYWKSMIKNFGLMAKAKFKVMEKFEENFSIKPTIEEYLIFQEEQKKSFKKKMPIFENQIKVIDLFTIPVSVIGMILAILKICNVV